jgi:hypothetical protein
VLDRVNRRDKFSMKKPLRSSARGASFHTKHASNANVGRVVLLDANSYLVLAYREHLRVCDVADENRCSLGSPYMIIQNMFPSVKEENQALHCAPCNDTSQ